MKPGIYRISSRRGPDNLAPLGRVVVSNGHAHVLEDQGLSKIIPDGVIDAQTEGRWNNLEASPYFHVQSEADLEPREVKTEKLKPDEAFDVVDDVLGTRRRLEAYGDDMFLDGVRLDARQAEDVSRRVRLGELHLMPAQEAKAD